jgi:multiple RNA-binding domain-containing protein 1
VRLALGETKLIEENREYFKKHNVDVDLASLASAGAASKKRSGTTILVKNLPYETQPEDLTKIFSPFGTVSRLLLPPSRAVAIVEFAQPGEARRAFKKVRFAMTQIGFRKRVTWGLSGGDPPNPPGPSVKGRAKRGRVVPCSLASLDR